MQDFLDHQVINSSSDEGLGFRLPLFLGPPQSYLLRAPSSVFVFFEVLEKVGDVGV